MKKSMFILFTAAAALGVLAACGGGGDPAPAPTPAPTAAIPASASQNVPGLIAYLKALVATQPGNLEPVDASAFTPQVSNTTEPDTL
jgi:hypothetical protein